MRAFLLVVLLVVLSVIVTSSVLPFVLAASPASREGPVGMTIAAGILVTTFALLWLFWPRRKSEPRQ